MHTYASGISGKPKSVIYSKVLDAWFLLHGLAGRDDQQGDLDAEALRIYASGTTGKATL